MSGIAKAILIGDSIRMGYQVLVSKMLSGQVQVWAPTANGGTSANILNHLREWILTRQADIIHLNCGLHDLVIEKEHGYRVPPDEYGGNLKKIVGQISQRTSARLIWATTTPVIDERHQLLKPFVRHEEDVKRYNGIALEVARHLPVDDLHAVTVAGGVEECLQEDGVHMTNRGYQLLAQAVVGKIRTVLGLPG